MQDAIEAVEAALEILRRTVKDITLASFAEESSRHTGLSQVRIITAETQNVSAVSFAYRVSDTIAPPALALFPHSKKMTPWAGRTEDGTFFVKLFHPCTAHERRQVSMELCSLSIACTRPKKELLRYPTPLKVLPSPISFRQTVPNPCSFWRAYFRRWWRPRRFLRQSRRTNKTRS